MPFPDPLLPPVIVSQDELLLAFQAQLPAEADTSKLPLPPSLPNGAPVEEIA